MSINNGGGGSEMNRSHHNIITLANDTQNYILLFPLLLLLLLCVVVRWGRDGGRSPGRQMNASAATRSSILEEESLAGWIDGWLTD